ncbi:ABC-three component system middle component 7 [Bifidobacterium catenulatum]|uniref:ABC-three component system middle component 7 n=1 Tax=Bifidobacterium catenulatum TaxID=1686 RepID=UPI00254D5321|nr:ABC-three component system middle component 7 [Bifidobacterium catenulatum]
MRLPNKLYSYEESTLSKFPIVLRALRDSDSGVTELYERIKKSVPDVSEYMETLDSLYALGKIDIDDKEAVLRYVERDHE